MKMAEESTKACEDLKDNEMTNACEKSNHDDGLTKLEESEIKRSSNGFEITNAGIDEWINSDSTTSLTTKPKKSPTSALDISGSKIITNDDEMEITNDDEMENEEKRRKRGKRGGTRRGVGQQKGYNWNISRGGARSGKQMGQNRRVQRGGRGIKKQGIITGERNVAELTDLPDGILLVEDGAYVGYHCTYCNCVLGSLPIIKNHVIGFRHQLILEARNRLEEQKEKETNLAQSESENNAEKSDDEGDEKPEAVENSEEKETKDSSTSESTPTEDSSVKVFLPLKSSLEDDLAETSDPVVGLDYITEIQKPDETLFDCSLCKVVVDGDDMKVHIVGTRHRLMYLKTVEPQKIAELMTKNLQKAERNQEIKDYITLLMNEHGRGTILVRSEGSTTKDTTPGSENEVPTKKSKRGCFKCGEEGHMSYNCPNSDNKKKSDNKKSSGCFKCGQQGHKANECTEGGPGKPRSGCFNCGKEGHISKDCTEERKGSDAAEEEGNTGTSKRQIRAARWRQKKEKSLNEETKQQIPRNQSASQERCFTCGEEGHKSYNCPNSDKKKKSENKKTPVCFKCGQQGHKANECTEGGPGKQRSGCFNCGKEGHISKNCTEERKGPDASQKKGNQGIAGKPKKNTAFAGTGQRKRATDGATPPRKKQFRDNAYPMTQASLGELTGRNQYYDNYGYNRQLYQKEIDERLIHHNDYPQPAASTQKKEFGNEKDSVKLADIDLNDENDAGVVMNVINSLTEKFLQYKLKNIAGPAKEILEKSLKGESLLHALGNITDESNVRTIDKLSSTSDVPKRDVIDQPRHDFNEIRDLKPIDDVVAKPRHDWNDKRDIVPISEMMHQPRHDWNDKNEIASTRETMDQRQRSWGEARDTAYPKDRINQPSRDWEEARDAIYRDMMEQRSETRDTAYARDTRDQAKRDWDEARDTAYARNTMNQSQRDWDEARNTKSARDMVEQPQGRWNVTSNTGSARDTMDQPRGRWDETRDTGSARDIMDQPRGRWDETRDTGSARDIMDQPRSRWNETRDTGSARDIMDQPRDKWNETRYTASARDMMDQPRDKWNETRDVASARNMMDQPRDKWNETRDVASARDMMDQAQRKWSESRDVASARDMMDQSRGRWDQTRRSTTEENRNANSLNQLPRSWNELGKTSVARNTDPYSQSRYSSNKPEEVLSLRNTNASSFSKPQQNWNESGQNEAKRIWNETRDPLRSQSSRPFGKSTMGWNEKGGSTSSFMTQSSRMQSSTSSLPSRKSLDLPSYVDDLFDNYQKKIKAEKSSRSMLTSMDSGNRSYLTPSLTSRSLYRGPSSSSSFSRPSSFGQLSAAGSFANWK